MFYCATKTSLFNITYPTKPSSILFYNQEKVLSDHKRDFTGKFILTIGAIALSIIMVFFIIMGIFYQLKLVQKLNAGVTDIPYKDLTNFIASFPEGIANYIKQFLIIVDKLSKGDSIFLTVLQIISMLYLLYKVISFVSGKEVGIYGFIIPAVVIGLAAWARKENKGETYTFMLPIKFKSADLEENYTNLLTSTSICICLTSLGFVAMIFTYRILDKSDVIYHFFDSISGNHIDIFQTRRILNRYIEHLKLQNKNEEEINKKLWELQDFAEYFLSQKKQLILEAEEEKDFNYINFLNKIQYALLYANDKGIIKISNMESVI